MTTARALPDELTVHLDAIRELCERYRMRALYVFGSAVHGTFNPATSDLDFLVDVGEYDQDVAARLFDFSYDLERLVGRDINLITTGAQGYQPFLDEMYASRIPIHGA